MKKILLYATMFFAITAYKNVENPNITNLRPQTTTVTNVTSGVTTKFQYFVNNGIYSAPASTMGTQTATLVNYYHSTTGISNPKYMDKWHGQVGDYFVDAVIVGTPNISWQFQSVTVTYAP